MIKGVTRLLIGSFAIMIVVLGMSMRANADSNSQTIPISISANNVNKSIDFVFNLNAKNSQDGVDASLPGYSINDVSKVLVTLNTGSNDAWYNEFNALPEANEVDTYVWGTENSDKPQKSEKPDQIIQGSQLNGMTPAEYIFSSSFSMGNVYGSNLQFIGFGSKPTLTTDNASKIWAIDSIKIQYAKVPATTTVDYVDENGHTVKSNSINGSIGDAGKYTPVAPSGYRLAKQGQVDYQMAAKTNTLAVHVVALPVSTPTGSITTPTVTPKPNTDWHPTSSTTTSEPAVPNDAAVKGSVVYATKGIYMYKNADFTNAQRLAKYPKTKRVNRPMFVVTDYARSKAGVLRYKVRDVNHGSKTAGKVGYITASQKFVVPVYYQTVPKTKKLTVLSRQGVNAYRNVNLTKPVKHFKKGARLMVKKLDKHNLTTRYQLSNGSYVTANKKLVIEGNH